MPDLCRARGRAPRRAGWGMLVIVLVMVLFTGGSRAPVAPALAQERVPVHYDVFVRQDGGGTASVFFVDAVSGLSTVVNTGSGRDFTLVDDYVLYTNAQTSAIMRATLTGQAEPHPFVQRHNGATVRWITSPDRRAIAWVSTEPGRASEAFVAFGDGLDLRQLPIQGPDAPLELAPVALTNGMTRFVYDVAFDPAFDGTGSTAPYPSYQHLTAYSITTETFIPLPAEPNCPCGAGFTMDGSIFMRLEARAGNGPFTAHIWDIDSGAETRIDPPDLPYRRAGDVLINNSGTKAVYGVANQADDGTDRYAMIMIDIVAGQQYLIVSPDTTRYKPVGFIDEDSALMMIDITSGGTLKLKLNNGALQTVSNLTYLGTITSSIQR